jgi:hypothetical protein
MEYCRIHKDLSDEPGNACPLCECMMDKDISLSRWAIKHKEMQTQLTAQSALLAECREVVQRLYKAAVEYKEEITDEDIRDFNNLKSETAALLPKLEEALKGKNNG